MIKTILFEQFTGYSIWAVWPQMSLKWSNSKISLEQSCIPLLLS